METKYGKIKRISQFKYLGEIIQNSGMETKTNKSRFQKMETDYRLTQKSIIKSAYLNIQN